MSNNPDINPDLPDVDYDQPDVYHDHSEDQPIYLDPRRCIRVYEISQIRESVSRISKTWQGRVWSGRIFYFQVWVVLVSLFKSNQLVILVLADIRRNFPPGK